MQQINERRVVRGYLLISIWNNLQRGRSRLQVGTSWRPSALAVCPAIRPGVPTLYRYITDKEINTGVTYAARESLLDTIIVVH